MQILNVVFSNFEFSFSAKEERSLKEVQKCKRQYQSCDEDVLEGLDRV